MYSVTWEHYYYEGCFQVAFELQWFANILDAFVASSTVSSLTSSRGNQWNDIGSFIKITCCLRECTCWTRYLRFLSYEMQRGRLMHGWIYQWHIKTIGCTDLIISPVRARFPQEWHSVTLSMQDFNERFQRHRVPDHNLQWTPTG